MRSQSARPDLLLGQNLHSWIRSPDPVDRCHSTENLNQSFYFIIDQKDGNDFVPLCDPGIDGTLDSSHYSAGGERPFAEFLGDTKIRPELSDQAQQFSLVVAVGAAKLHPLKQIGPRESNACPREGSSQLSAHSPSLKALSADHQSEDFQGSSVVAGPGWIQNQPTVGLKFRDQGRFHSAWLALEGRQRHLDVRDVDREGEVAGLVVGGVAG